MARASIRRWNIGRDTSAGVFLLGALLLPWNLYFGLGIPGSRAAVFAVLVPATVLTLGSIAATYTGPRRMFGARFDPLLADRLRLVFAVPYLLLVLGFVVFDAVQTVRYGGTAHVPGGVGPGAWLGAAGALLAAQPVLTGRGGRFGGWLLSVRILGYASMAGAGLSVLFNLYWRIRFALPASGEATGFGARHLAITATAVVYGAVAWVTVFVGSRWALRRDKASRLATAQLGMSALAAGLLVWILPIGRVIDGFHGVAQNTSTAGVGFEGYLVWAAVAAVFAAPTLHGSLTGRPGDDGAWLAAARKVLLLISVWCIGSVLMRLADLTAAVILGLPYSPYGIAVMGAFDLVTAVLAVWLGINLANRSLRRAAIWSPCAVLVGFAVSRIVAGVGLAPRLAGPQPAGPVYGNDLAHQITSTFDVVLCVLALCTLMVALTAARVAVSQSRPASAAATETAGSSPPRPASAPRIFRPGDPARRSSGGVPKIYRTSQDPAPHGRHEA